jgi:hypothetical protein
MNELLYRISASTNQRHTIILEPSLDDFKRNTSTPPLKTMRTKAFIFENEGG